jgi:hypothetical protein
MTCMATWEDGPEYAPLQRPADFAPALAAPLSVAPPIEQMAALAPKDRPAFDQPPVPLTPLAALVPAPEETRDPQEPFAVVSATMTSDSAWGAVHWGGTPTGQLAGFGTATPLPGDPAQPLPVPGTQAIAPVNPFPAPGTPGWFGPGPYGEQSPEPPRIGAKAVWDAAMPGMCIVLAVGGLVYVVAPILFAVAFGLSRSVKVARDQVRRAFAIGAALLGLVCVLAALTNDEGFSRWWTVVGGWSLAACWAVLLATLLLVYRGLRAGQQPSQPARPPWG